MTSDVLLTARRTDLSAAAFIAQAGRVFAVFDQATQDSGNVCYGIEIDEHRLFLKTAGSTEPANAPNRATRIAYLRNAVCLHNSVAHHLLPALHNVIEAADGPILVYDWVAGELIGVPAEQRSDPRSAFNRFRRLPLGELLPAIDAIIDLHSVLVAAGWVAVDFYDGSLMYDFTAPRLHVVDLDLYHQGPFVNDMGRMFGSTRFMAPEEFERGAVIDELTTVFLMGRTILELLSENSDHRTFRGGSELRAIADRACAPVRAERYPSVQALLEAWCGASELGLQGRKAISRQPSRLNTRTQ